MRPVAKYNDFEFFQIEESDKETYPELVKLHNGTFPSSRQISEELLGKRVTNGFVLVAILNKRIESVISGLYTSREHILRSANWSEVTTNGSFSYSDTSKEALLLTAVSSRRTMERGLTETNEITNTEVTNEEVEKYMQSGKDLVAKFHMSPKAGLRTGAVPIMLVPNGSKGDHESMNFAVVYEYPNLEDQELFFTGSRAGLLIVEAAIMFAQQQGKYEVLAYSRFAELSKFASVSS